MDEEPVPESNDINLWADASTSWYDNENLDSSYGQGAKPLNKFLIRIAGRTLKFRVASRRDLETKRYFCKGCPSMYYETMPELREHMLCHSPPVIRRKCPHCDVQYISSRALAIHCRFVHGETMGYKCDLCEKQFTRKHYLMMHARYHDMGDRFFCNKCGHWYRKQEELIEHQAFCDTRKKGSYQCSYCEKAFSYPRDKALHERTHTGEKPFGCSLCTAQFSQLSALRVHVRTHTGERKYACRFCSVRFVDSSAARRHEIKHHFTESRERAAKISPLPDSDIPLE